MSQISKRRVVVTGLGAITPLGNDVPTFWEAVLAGKSGIGPIEGFDTEKFSTRFAGQIKNFDPSSLGFQSKELKRMDPFIQYGVASGKQAIDESGLLEFDGLDKTRVGFVVGAGIGGVGTIEVNHRILMESGPRRVSPFFIPGCIINMIAGHLSIAYGFQGPNLAVATACTTGTHSISLAARTIQMGDADVMIAGGSERGVTPISVAGFSSSRALSSRNDDPQKASRPWDKDRDGFVMGDGAGTLILEEYEHAKKRGAPIYAEVSGIGMSGDGYHITRPAPGGEGGFLAMKAALKDGGISPEEIGYINAHATSTPAGDVEEIKGIKRAFGEHAKQLAISSTKSMTGHLLGAAGAIEAILTVLALKNQIVPPTINLDNPDEECDLNLVPHTPQEKSLSAVMSNSFGFGGTNGTIIFKKVS